MRNLSVDLKERGYPIWVGPRLGAEAAICDTLRAAVDGRRCLLVTDAHVAPLHLAAATALLTRCGAGRLATHTIPAGESSKTLATVETLYSAALAAGLDRRSVAVALGGGVVGDLTGFFAATWLRGIPVLQMPTSLLAQVDSSIGGKTGVDLPAGKNLVGAFHQPLAVVADLDWLRTLPPREWRCGMAEVIKYAMIGDAALGAFLTAQAAALERQDPAAVEEMVGRCAAQKAAVVARDELETRGLRAVLNYGHTFGHALETLGGYSLFSHGEAVAIGMGMAADLAVRLQMAPATLPAAQDALLRRFGLPWRCPPAPGLAAPAILEAMQHDKKARDGKLRFVVVPEAGRADTVTVEDRDLLLQVIGGRCD